MIIQNFRSFFMPLCYLCLAMFVSHSSFAKTAPAVPDLSISINGNSIELEWRIPVDQQKGNFELERSLNGEEFISLGTQQLVEEKKYGIIYSFTDEKAMSLGLPKFFYRLKYNSPTGESAYSEVTEVSTLSSKKELSLIGYNQVDKQKYIVHFKGKGKVQMSVINMLGQVKFKQKYNNLKGSKTIYLFTKNWESGAYVIDLKQGQKRARYKFVLP